MSERPDTSIPRALAAVAEETFVRSLLACSTPSVLLDRIRSSEECRNLREALRAGLVNDDTLREFVHRLIKSRIASPHRTDVALATLCACLGDVFTPLADEYLEGLSKVRVPELALASRVAILVVIARRHRTFSVTRVLPYATKVGGKRSIVPMRIASPTNITAVASLEEYRYAAA